jgi:hypothetical protein
LCLRGWNIFSSWYCILYLKHFARFLNHWMIFSFLSIAIDKISPSPIDQLHMLMLYFL